MARLRGYLLLTLFSLALSACDRLQLTGDEASPSADKTQSPLIVTAGKRAFLFDCLKKYGAKQADNCDVQVHRSELSRRYGSNDYFYWALIALLSDDPSSFAPFICRGLDVGYCYRLLGIGQSEVDSYPRGRCRQDWFWHHEFALGHRNGCGSWNHPWDDDHHQNNDWDRPGQTIYGYNDNGAYNTCVQPGPAELAPVCSYAMTPQHEAWLDRCRKAGFQVQSCRCKDYCTGYVTPAG